MSRYLVFSLFIILRNVSFSRSAYNKVSFLDDWFQSENSNCVIFVHEHYMLKFSAKDLKPVLLEVCKNQFGVVLVNNHFV